MLRLSVRLLYRRGSLGQVDRAIVLVADVEEVVLGFLGILTLPTTLLPLSNLLLLNVLFLNVFRTKLCREILYPLIFFAMTEAHVVAAVSQDAIDLREHGLDVDFAAVAADHGVQARLVYDHVERVVLEGHILDVHVREHQFGVLQPVEFLLESDCREAEVNGGDIVEALVPHLFRGARDAAADHQHLVLALEVIKYLALLAAFLHALHDVVAPLRVASRWIKPLKPIKLLLLLLVPLFPELHLPVVGLQAQHFVFLKYIIYWKKISLNCF